MTTLLLLTDESVAEFVQSLAHQDQVCVERARTCSHAVDVSCSAIEFYREVCGSIFQLFNEHLPLDGALLRLRVRKGLVNSNRAHRYLSVSLTREWYLDHTKVGVEVSFLRA